MTQVFVVKTVDKDTGEPIPGVFEELEAGRARIGWSYEDHLDLRLIQQKITLDESEQEAKRCLGFLNRPTISDYLLYPNQPVRGQFCVIQITGEYDYSSAENGLRLPWTVEAGYGSDFRSFRPCSFITSVDRYDEIVPSQLRRRLGKPGRFSKVSDTKPFFGFLSALPEAGSIQDGSNRPSLERIHRELRKKLPDELRREFGGHDLSRKFCPDLFERMGYTCIVREGPDERGSDVVVTVGSPVLLDSVEIRIGVQVFAYEGAVEEREFPGEAGPTAGGLGLQRPGVRHPPYNGEIQRGVKRKHCADTTKKIRIGSCVSSTVTNSRSSSWSTFRLTRNSCGHRRIPR